MGLLDILSSIQTGGGLPGMPGARPGEAPASQSQSMSPIAKALLALLAVYAVKHMRREGSPSTQPGQPSGGTITARYIDADDGSGGHDIPRDATAQADCVAPLITGLGSEAISLTCEAAIGRPSTSPPLNSRTAGVSLAKSVSTFARATGSARL